APALRLPGVVRLPAPQQAVAFLGEWTPHDSDHPVPHSAMPNDALKPASLPVLLVVLTITTGLIDAVSVLGLGRVFTANMTGNIVLLGFALARVPAFSARRSLAALAALLVRSVIAERLVTRLDGSRR